MKGFAKFIISFLTAVLVAIFSGSVFATALEVPMYITAPAIMLMSFIPMPSGVTFMAVQKEIWTNYIVEHLFKNNNFLNFAINHDQYVVGGKVVHIPQAGAPSGAVRNRTNLPATVTIRNDIDILYALDEFTTNPRLITNAEQVELSYDKIQSVIGEDTNVLRELVAEWILYHWRPEGSEQIIRTSGDPIPAHLPNGTGNRKKITIEDLRKAKVKFNKQGIPLADRYCMLDAEIENQLTSELTAGDAKDFSRYYDAENGIIGKLESFNIITRESVLAASNDATPIVFTPDATLPSDANAVALCWHRSAVARALGEVKMFEDTNSPQYYGDVYSFLLRAGGKKHRNDQKGIVGIVQAHA